jgi:hypothetical protein
VILHVATWPKYWRARHLGTLHDLIIAARTKLHLAHTSPSSVLGFDGEKHRTLPVAGEAARRED